MPVTWFNASRSEIVAEIAPMTFREENDFSEDLSPPGGAAFGEDSCGECKQQGFYTRRMFMRAR